MIVSGYGCGIAVGVATEKIGERHAGHSRCFERADEVRNFSKKVVCAQSLDSRLEERFAFVERANQSYMKAVDLTGNPDFWIDIRPKL